MGAGIKTDFRECIEFFFPRAAAEIDWERGYNFLDKELQQRFVDKFVQVWLKDVTEQWVLIHLEVQSYEEKDFAKRMYFLTNYQSPISNANNSQSQT